MSLKHWIIPEQQPNIVKRLSAECDVTDFVAEILANRNLTSFRQAFEFVNDNMEFEDPFSIKDMDIAVERIRKALDNFEKIAIYGDYDCDGVTSVFLLYSYLQYQGADVMFYIPKRENEGYGMNKNAIQSLCDQNVNLIITVDNGISAIEEIDFANSLGMEVIVTDHHQVGDIMPNALAIVNPHRKDCESKFKFLAGVGVAFKLITAMEDCDYDYTFSQFGDILAIGTVADIVPLVGENRSIVKLGLEYIKNTDNVGLCALMQTANINVDNLSSQNIAFGIAPRLNSAGRMDDAKNAVKLLLSEDMDEALELAQNIEVFNQNRKHEEEKILDDIKGEIIKNPQSLNDRVLVFAHENWHHGVIGISSSKILEMFGKPNILLSSDGDLMRGSARSLGDFSLYNALTNCSQYLKRYGGHKLAAGLAIKPLYLEDFKLELEDYAKTNHKIMPVFSYNVDKIIKPNDLTIANIKSLDVLQPFGCENQEPIFLFENAIIKEIIPLSNNKHVKLKLSFGSTIIQAIMFGISTDDFSFSVGQTIDFVAQVSINQYNGKEYLSIIMKDIHLTGFSQKGFFLAKSYYHMFKRSEVLSDKVLQKAIPSRDDIAVVYKHLKKLNGYDVDIDLLFNDFVGNGINYFKFRLILDVLHEAKLINLSPLLDKISLCEVVGKVDLQNTDTMKKLNNI